MPGSLGDVYRRGIALLDTKGRLVRILEDAAALDAKLSQCGSLGHLLLPRLRLVNRRWVRDAQPCTHMGAVFVSLLLCCMVFAGPLLERVRTCAVAGDVSVQAAGCLEGHDVV